MKTFEEFLMEFFVHTLRVYDSWEVKVNVDVNLVGPPTVLPPCRPPPHRTTCFLQASMNGSLFDCTLQKVLTDSTWRIIMRILRTVASWCGGSWKIQVMILFSAVFGYMQGLRWWCFWLPKSRLIGCLCVCQSVWHGVCECEDMFADKWQVCVIVILCTHTFN